jgi:hypothetical protein
MRDFIEFVSGMVLVIVVIAVTVGALVGITEANAQWNCRAYHATTGEPTRVIAGDCFVQRGGEWVIYDAVVNPKRVQLEGTK